MFDIEQSVAAWRQKMLAAGITAPIPLEELESHLREEVDRKIQAGFSAQTAFESAVMRLGQSDALKVEFEKISTSGLPYRYLCLFCFLSAPLLAFVNICVLQPGEISPWARIGGLTAMSVAALYLSALPFFYERLPSLRHRLVRTVMLLGFLFAMVCPLIGIFISLGMINLKVRINVEMTIWSVGAAWFATWLAYEVSGEVNSAMMNKETKNPHATA